MLVLGIETSCDETAVAVVSRDGKILGEAMLSQVEDHRPFGGIVPEVAARAHLESVDGLVARAMNAAGVGFGDLAAVGVAPSPALVSRVKNSSIAARVP